MEVLWTSVLGVLPLRMGKGEIKAIAYILGEVPEIGLSVDLGFTDLSIWAGVHSVSVTRLLPMWGLSRNPQAWIGMGADGALAAWTPSSSLELAWEQT